MKGLEAELDAENNIKSSLERLFKTAFLTGTLALTTSVLSGCELLRAGNSFSFRDSSYIATKSPPPVSNPGYSSWGYDFGYSRFYYPGYFYHRRDHAHQQHHPGFHHTGHFRSHGRLHHIGHHDIPCD